MTLIQTKFSIGDTVYAPQAEHETVQVECPDCLGTKTWRAVLPNGEEHDFSCPTCSYGYEVRGTIGSYEVQSRVRVLTIGSVRVDTAHVGSREGPQYMCKETGVGSGTMWPEASLHATYAEAEALLPKMAEDRKVSLEETRARSVARRKKDREGSMVGHYRRQIRDAKKDIEAAERGLAREAAK